MMKRLLRKIMSSCKNFMLTLLLLVVVGFFTLAFLGANPLLTLLFGFLGLFGVFYSANLYESLRFDLQKYIEEDDV